jgi:hypothetical protein
MFCSDDEAREFIDIFRFVAANPGGHISLTPTTPYQEIQCRRLEEVFPPGAKPGLCTVLDGLNALLLDCDLTFAHSHYQDNCRLAVLHATVGRPQPVPSLPLP